MDIPLDGTISFFPLTDGSAIVTKQIQMDGTSKTIIYKPSDEKEPEKKKEISEYLINAKLNDKQLAYLYDKYYSSEKVLDSLLSANIPIKEFIQLGSLLINLILVIQLLKIILLLISLLSILISQSSHSFSLCLSFLLKII